MPGLHPQSKRKRDKRAVDMSPDAPSTRASWQPPGHDELDDEQRYLMPPPGADPARDRVIVRVQNHAASGVLAVFAVVHETFDRGEWRKVVAVDNSHGSDVHLHRYSRTTGNKLRNPEHLMALTCLSDVQSGYDLAYTKVIEEWARNKQRWEHG